MQRLRLLLPLLASHAAAAQPSFVDVTEESGLVFEHRAAHSPAHLYPETFGGGIALFDLDGDGDLDVFFVDSGSPPGAAIAVPARHRLYRNVSVPAGPFRFEEVEPPQLPGLTGMGACAGDIDGDGLSELWITGLPRGRLLENRGGRLVEASPAAGADDPGWSTSCVFLDADRDGVLDLYSVHYVIWSAEEERECGGEVEGFKSYCPPQVYEAEADRLFLGRPEKGFREAEAHWGRFTGGKGLGVVVADLDGDRRPDLYVANDGVANQLWLAQADGRFRDQALLSGTAFDEAGRAQAGMGVDAGDLNGDGRPDLWVSNLDLETNSLLLYLGGGPLRPRFRDAVHASGLGQATLQPLGFGTVLADFDLDGDLDIFVGNGHVIPEIAVVRADQSWAMEDQLFENLGGSPTPKFRDARERWLPAAADRRVSRGVAVGDLDSDGDLDLVIVANGGRARLLRNESATPESRWLGLSLKATRSAPGAPGSLARLTAGRQRTVLRRTGGSYLSSSDPRLLFGLGDAPAQPRAHEVEVQWTTGDCERFGPLAEGGYHEVVEGSGRACAAEVQAGAGGAGAAGGAAAH